MIDLHEQIAGVLLGTTVGDALGVPREGVSRRRAQRLFGDPPLTHRFLFGCGLVSDDTDHTCLVGQALLAAPDDPERFARALAWGLRWWLLSLPAGIGRATLRALVKLWLGFPPARSGVWSAGNGPAMRSALLGVCLGHDRLKLRNYVRAATRLTHTDPRAERGALLVALAAHYGARQGAAGVEGLAFLTWARNEVPDADAELARLLATLEDHCRRAAPARELADTLGLKRGVTGYIYHTVPVALYCWLRSPGDFRQAVEEAIVLGGDADTTGAIVGAIAGATVGAHGIPSEWLDGAISWPFSSRWQRTLAQRLALQMASPAAVPKANWTFLCWPGLFVRNFVFLLVVLIHLVRRLLPPY